MANHLLLYSLPAFRNVSTQAQIPCQHCQLLVDISKATTGDLRQLSYCIRKPHLSSVYLSLLRWTCTSFDLYPKVSGVLGTSVRFQKNCCGHYLCLFCFLPIWSAADSTHMDTHISNYMEIVIRNWWYQTSLNLRYFLSFQYKKYFSA